MEYVNFIRTMADFGLVVLIWLVQLIIYPGFMVIRQDAFDAWHRKYMVLVTFVVAPLMFAQLFLAGLQLWINSAPFIIASTILIVLVWLHTFIKAVPLHNALSREGNQPSIVDALVKANWYRTIIWSLLWLFGLAAW